MSEASSHKATPVTPSESSAAPKTAGGEGSNRSAPQDLTDPQMTVISARPPLANLQLGRGVPPLEAGSLLEGERLGQFLLQKFVGGGGMGVVFRALDTTLNREVAVKVLSRDQSADEETLRRFRNEAQSAARLNHDNIARVHYVGEDRGVHYIVFEFIEGVNIRDLVEQKGPLPLPEALSYTFQIAEALAHASQRDVIHRDIKPSNVLITPDGKAKLVDMGLARLNQVAHSDNDLTASGVTLGTFDYISPEQARDPRSADVRSDLYSLGCSFFYMLTGRPPFPDGTVLQKLLQHQADHPPDPRAARPELPIEVTQILARLLAKNPLQRYQQPGELSEELAALGEKLGMQLSSSRTAWVPPRPNPIARWQHHLPWIVPIGALCLIVLGLDFYWSSAHHEIVGPIAPAGTAANADSSHNATTVPPTNPPATGPHFISNKPVVPPLAPKPAVSTPSARAGEPPGAEFLPDAPQGVPPESAPWMRRLATLSWGAELNFEELTARAADAVKLGSQVAPRPLGPPEDAAISTGQPAVDAAEIKPKSKPIAPRDGLLTVSDGPAGAGNYATLHAACSDAKSGDIIELRYNGRRLEKAITISNLKLTIRAGEQYQPVVVFRPEPDPVKFPPSMLSIAGGQLNVSNVHWELDLPRDVPADWALFETRRADLVRFEKCTFTVRNASLGQTAYHAGVAFFDIKAPPGTNVMAMDPNVMEDQIVTIELQHCIARGEAAFVRSNELQAFRLTWDNGLLATSERLLVAAGGPSQPRQLGHTQLHLAHLTAMLHNGLALLINSEDAPYQLLTEIDCVDSILVSTARPPLIEQRGSDRIEEYLARLQWNGDRDFFAGFETFWQILNNAEAAGSKQMSFADWQQFWGDSRSRLATRDSVVWKHLPGTNRPFHTHTPNDYALDLDVTHKGASGGASDGLDAGCLVKQLPLLPPDERGETKPTPRNSILPARGANGS
ncbi:MAG: protein kinase [Planctomycetia bacterium]|nr:protein kinase [Planctomycetia bacterium]